LPDNTDYLFGPSWSLGWMGCIIPQAEGLQKAQISAWAGEAFAPTAVEFIFDLPGHIDRIHYFNISFYFIVILSRHSRYFMTIAIC